MSLFSKNIELERVSVRMDYDTSIGFGQAAVSWDSIRDHPILSVSMKRVALACLLYGRTLVNHSETRGELFQHVQQAAQGLVSGASHFVLDTWILSTRVNEFQLWPWQAVQPDQLKVGKTYIATLLELGNEQLGIHLKMAWGLERILAPSAPLIALTAVTSHIEAQDKVKLGRALIAMNTYYGTASEAAGIMSDVRAFKVALPELIT